MIRLITHRLLLAVVLLFVVSAMTFVLTAIAPGDPAATILGTSASPEAVEELRDQLGLNQPIVVQYWTWLQGAVRGDFGNSLVSSQNVTEAVADRLPVTISLVLLATLVTVIVGVALGLISAVRGGAVGKATDVLAVAGYVIPNFWLGLMLVLIFAVNLGWLPATGYVDFSASPIEWLRSLILPVIALAVIGITAIAKQTRDAMRQVMGSEFITVLRADGFPEWRIVLRHGLRNAAIPIVTGAGVLVIGMFGGTVLIESVFVLPGIGSLAVTAARSGDIYVLQGVTVVFCVVVIVTNLIIDLLYGWLNPKVRVR
ncbi:ABC transporter permease [Microbacterium timonense]|uniref:ABC transporter permease n=1 Tax=Microbacterium timonense TaxID=2086576 RepID=UPI000D0F4FB1|nr:ABC transporter permease [Microbacterium timonense]